MPDEVFEKMETLHSAARLMRSHPRYSAPEGMLDGVRMALRQTGSSLLD